MKPNAHEIAVSAREFAKNAASLLRLLHSDLAVLEQRLWASPAVPNTSNVELQKIDLVSQSINDLHLALSGIAAHLPDDEAINLSEILSTLSMQRSCDVLMGRSPHSTQNAPKEAHLF